MKTKTPSGLRTDSHLEPKQKPDPRFSTEKIYNKWHIKLEFRNLICGGVPRNPELIESWIKAKTGHEDEKAKELTEEAIEAMKVELTDASWNGFKADKGHGLYIEARQVKAMFREGFTMTKVFVKKRGSKQMYQHGLEIKGIEHPEHLYLGRDKADGSMENPIHVQTAQGPRSALKRLDYIKGATVEFELWIYKVDAKETRSIGEKELIHELTLLQEDGCGADSSQGNGKFDVIEFRKKD